MRKLFAALLALCALPATAQTRTFSPTLRVNSPAPLTITQVDANFTGISTIANQACRTYFSGSQTGMLSLSPAPLPGDRCWRTDIGDAYTFLGGDPTVLANWATAGVGGVSSVFGRQGVVTAQTGDYTVSQVTGAAPLASPTFTGTVNAPTLQYSTLLKWTGGSAVNTLTSTLANGPSDATFSLNVYNGSGNTTSSEQARLGLFYTGNPGLSAGIGFWRGTGSLDGSLHFITNNTDAGNVASTGNWTFTGSATATSFSGAGTGLTGTASSLTSGSTNALKSATTTVNVSSATAPTTGQVLTATSSTTATWQTPSAGTHLTRVTFTSSGSWTCPAGVNYIDLTMVGGGGAGGDSDGSSNGGGGGGAGATIRERIPVTPGTQYDITIGAGGTATSGLSGTAGGDTTFAVHGGATVATAKGGSGGAVGGAGGSSGGPDPQLGGAAGQLAAVTSNNNSVSWTIALRFGQYITGGAGSVGGTSSVASVVGGKCESYNGGSVTAVKYGGNGGATPFGPGGNGATGTANAPTPAANTGVGGGGGSFTTTPRAPAGGASGYAFIEYF